MGCDSSEPLPSRCRHELLATSRYGFTHTRCRRAFLLGRFAESDLFLGHRPFGGIMLVMRKDDANEDTAVSAQLIGKLFDEHARALVAYARQLCPDPSDVVQEAFMKLAEERRPPSNPVAWLYGVVRNEALMAVRTARRRRHRESRAVENKDRWFRSSGTEPTDVDSICNAMKSLSESEREIVTAHIWGGLSFRDIAGLLKISSSSAHRVYGEALNKLRNQIGISCPRNR